ncbi:hypothetical protein LIER_35348 [Lithospermum erythrorhizon]|uniref:Uncharacterized protein n=1 Tax=Lithospermum erythrorhizon TaxID=34254 RepID=A0AAV3NT28_LITER
MPNYQTNKKNQTGCIWKAKKFPQEHIIGDKPVKSYGSSTGHVIHNSVPQETKKKVGAKPHDAYNKKHEKILPSAHISAAEVDRNVDHGQGNYKNDEQFSEYISRVKGGLRSESYIGIGIEPVPTKGVARRDSLNDNVSNFLSRARLKFRTSTTVGDKKRTSIEGK